MPPEDDFSNDYGWDEEPLPQRERHRKAKSGKHFDREKWDKEAKRPPKHAERPSRRPQKWNDDDRDEY